MGNTLRSYAIRQIALPTFMALLTITFIFMIQSMYQVINLLMLPDVTLLDVGKLLGLLLPSVLIFSTPMAVLIGCLIGVGRMTMDREILAIRASGVNLISVFMPTMAAGLILSATIFILSATWIPSTLYKVQLQKNELALALANALQPGRFYDKLFGGDAILYFASRDPETGMLKKVVLEREEDVTIKPKAASADGATSASMQAAEKPARAVQAGGKAPASGKLATLAGQASKAAGAGEAQTELSLIFASTGRIDAEQLDAGPDAPPDSSIVLTLENGSIHRLSADPATREYADIHFDRLEHHDFSKGEVDKRQKTIGSAGLRRQIAQLEKDPSKRAQRDIGALLKEIWQRRAMWLASFVFILTGIPLAIWVRPSGKSWGILLAIALLLIYYVILQTGLTMIASARPGGILVAMAPNILYALLGAYLWRQTLRS